MPAGFLAPALDTFFQYFEANAAASVMRRFLNLCGRTVRLLINPLLFDAVSATNVTLREAKMADEDDYSKQSFEKIKQLYDEFHHARLLEYIELVNSPKKLFWLNFFSGLAKGLGLTIGTAIVLTLLFKAMQHLIALNIPYLTVWISDWIGQVSTLLKATGK